MLEFLSWPWREFLIFICGVVTGVVTCMLVLGIIAAVRLYRRGAFDVKKAMIGPNEKVKMGETIVAVLGTPEGKQVIHGE